MPSLLTPREFRPNLQFEVAGFDCGDDLWSLAAAQWITGQGVIESIVKGTSVWLYRLHDETVVGFGSLGTAQWTWPESFIPSNEVLSVIPQVAIQRQFQGQPRDAPKEARYSTQIMNHLLDEAYEQDTRFVALQVDEGNEKAIRLYESYGFTKSKKKRKTKFPDGSSRKFLKMYLQKKE